MGILEIITKLSGMFFIFVGLIVIIHQPNNILNILSGMASILFGLAPFIIKEKSKEDSRK